MSIPTEHKPLWYKADGLRIWRCPESRFSGDESREAADVYTDQVFADILADGFNAVWIRGKLRDLIRSSIFPELNSDDAPARLESLRQVIARGRCHGVGVYLFFNEPIAINADDPFWNNHADVAGQTYGNDIDGGPVIALCTSTDTVRRFMAEATGQIFDSLPALAGVILITASELHTHCWSHYFRFSLHDGINGSAQPPFQCSRCARREPAEVVAELIDIWCQAARRAPAAPRILAWNWSWSMWYADPQSEIINRLAPPVELLADWERGGIAVWNNTPLLIDEYSLRYIGPSQRFLGAQRLAQQRSLTVHAKLQIGTTHEIATVPNLPLIANLHRKFVRMKTRQVAGVLATWNFGCSLTLNSFALGLFCSDPVSYGDYAVFTADLARRYFGAVDADKLVKAWHLFSQAFKNYPFAIQFLYYSPLNYAPAVALTSHYRGQPLGPSWLVRERGDRFDDCLADFTLDQIIESFATISQEWDTGLAEYRAALDGRAIARYRLHCFQELSTAAMIASQLRSFLNLAKFHRWRLEKLAEIGATWPCDLPLDAAARHIMADECDNARVALELTQADPRLGWHQECHAYLYDAPAIRTKLQQMQHELALPQAAVSH